MNDFNFVFKSHVCTGHFYISFSSLCSSLPASALPHLEQQLDWNDLIEIAHHMLDWEEKLCTHLGLTAVQSSQQL